MRRGLTSTLLLIVALLTSAAPAGAPSPAGLLEDARRAFDAGDYSAAVDLYGRLREQMPAAAQIPYNQGVAAYRAGDWDRAAEFFEEALSLAGDPAMQSRSAYNLGTSAYARNLQGPTPSEAEAADVNAQLENATNELTDALKHYRRAIDIDPADADAKANAELAWRRLKRLQELQQQLQQMPQQEQQDGQEQQEQQEQQPQEQQDNQQQQDRDQQPQQQQSQDENATDQMRAEQQQQAGQDEQEQQQQTGEEQEQQAQQAAEGGEEAEEQSEHQAAAERKPMSREEAERLLQSVRDKEKNRREELARRENTTRPPVDKDW